MLYNTAAAHGREFPPRTWSRDRRPRTGENVQRRGAVSADTDDSTGASSKYGTEPWSYRAGVNTVSYYNSTSIISYLTIIYERGNTSTIYQFASLVTFFFFSSFIIIISKTTRVVKFKYYENSEQNSIYPPPPGVNSARFARSPVRLVYLW